MKEYVVCECHDNQHVLWLRHEVKMIAAFLRLRLVGVAGSEANTWEEKFQEEIFATIFVRL